MTQTILDCGHAPSPHSDFTTGYGQDAQGRTHCYACCAENDKASMIETGRATLYLTREQPDAAAAPAWYVTNWPGSLRMHAFVRKGRHNMAGKRYDVWFTGPDGKDWHGVTYGDNTQICHCRRLKA